MEKTEGNGNVPMVNKACLLIKIMTDHGGVLGISSLAKESGLSKSTVFRILQTLQSWDFIQKNDNDEQYQLGNGFIAVGEQVKMNMNIQEIALPVMKKIASATGESVNLGILHEDKVIVMDSVVGESSFVVANLEPVFPLYCSGIGKLFLSQFTENEIDRYYRDYSIETKTINTIDSAGAMKNEVEKIRRQGFSIDLEEYEYGLECIAAPIFDGSNKLVAGISISGPSSRIKVKGDKNLIDQVMAAADVIGQKLNYKK